MPQQLVGRPFLPQILGRVKRGVMFLPFPGLVSSAARLNSATISQNLSRLASVMRSLTLGRTGSSTFSARRDVVRISAKTIYKLFDPSQSSALVMKAVVSFVSSLS